MKIIEISRKTIKRENGKTLIFAIKEQNGEFEVGWQELETYLKELEEQGYKVEFVD